LWNGSTLQLRRERGDDFLEARIAAERIEGATERAAKLGRETVRPNQGKSSNYGGTNSLTTALPLPL